MKAFKLIRLFDVSGISGTGVVAEGVEFDDGQCVIHWLTRFASLGIYPSRAVMMLIHGHDNKTVAVDVALAAPLLQVVSSE